MPDDDDAALASLAPLADLDAESPVVVAGAVRSLAQRLRAGEVELESLIAIAERLVPLARDARHLVRQSVAEASPYLPEPAFRAIVTAVAEDRNPWVKKAAEDAHARRADLRRGEANTEEHDARVARWYAELHAPEAAIARRIAAHEREYFVRRMSHEAGSAFLAYGTTMMKLRAAVEAPALDRAELRALLDRVDERFRFFQHVLEEGRTHSRPVEPAFAGEDLGAIVADEVEILPLRFPDRAERIAVDASGVERPIAIDADAGLLRQALGNVLKNAVEAYGERHEGPIRLTVTVSARANASEASDAKVTVRDYGRGMPDAVVASAFVPFHSTTKPGGTGFGLYIARRNVVAGHGGDLRIASQPGEGTTVTLTLPLRQVPTSAQKKARRARKTQATRSARR